MLNYYDNEHDDNIIDQWDQLQQIVGKGWPHYKEVAMPLITGYSATPIYPMQNNKMPLVMYLVLAQVLLKKRENAKKMQPIKQCRCQ
ncbi:MAG: hypothetical protein FWC91_04190 [Defluviitaleaceae bacterium]|nr:hypothetical protein [Defluviitaleaceae bacterium]